MEEHGSCVCNLGSCKNSLKKYRLGWDIHVNPMGEQGWCSGESTRLPPVWPGFDSRSRCHNLCGLSLLLVLVLAPRVFLRVLRFSSLHKNQHFQIPIRPGCFVGP